MESENASNQKEMKSHEQETKCIENDTSKSSMDSSFAVQDYNCSSFAEQIDGNPEEVSNSKDDIVVKSNTTGDGNDSGVEIGALSSINGVLQRALSSNSGGYASSCGGLEDQIGQLSCNSSVISYCSESGEKTNNTVVVADFCASEGGSESSSITNGPTSRKSNSASKKKVAVKEPTVRSPRKSNELNGNRSRPTSVSRSNTLPSKSVAPNLTPRERTRSRDTNMTKSESMQITPKSSISCLLSRSTVQNKRPSKPDSLPGSIKDSYRDLSLSSPRVQVSRTPSLTRGRTPLATPTNDDGRWPSINSKCNSAGNQRLMRATSTHPESLTIKTKIGNIHLDQKSSITVDKYATLPRRRKEKSQEDLKDKESRSSSTNRDRMTVSMIKRVPSKDVKDQVTTPIKSYPKIAKKPVLPKTKIYHETSVQTALTSKDLEDAFAGKAKEIKIDAVEHQTKETQSDIRDKEYEKMEAKIAKVNAEYSQLLNKLTEKSQMVSSLEHQLLKEREEKLVAQKELQNNSERVMNMLDAFKSPSGEDNGGDSLLMLESQMLISGNVLEKQQEEISKLQRICRSLHRDMEKSLKVQANLICQKNELEEESTELQDFLQAEKVAFMEALKEAENEIQMLKNKVVAKDIELDRQQEECRHLVRICEQRRYFTFCHCVIHYN